MAAVALQEWALQNGVSADVRSFIRFRPGLLFQFDPSAGARSFPTPRSWEFVSQVASVTPQSLLLPVVSGCVGEGPAAEYIAFRQLYTQLPDPTAVLANPQGTTVPTEPAVLYALIGALVERARKGTDAELNAMATFCNRMPDEFGTLGMRDTLAVAPRFIGLPATAAWAKNHADLFGSTAS